MSKVRRSINSRLVLPMIIILVMTIIVPQYARAFSPDTYTWSSPNLTYRIDSSFSSLGSNYVTALNDAISDWNSSATLVSFTQSSSSSNSIQAADLGVGGPLAQVPPHHPTGTNFRFSPFTLTINTRYLGQFYVGPRTSTISASQYDLRSVIRHELGHTFGLCHTWNNATTLMWPNTNLGEVHNIDQDALDGANYVYNPGSAPITPEGGCGNTSNPLIASAGIYDDTFADGTRSYQITYGNAPSWARVSGTSWPNADAQTLSYTNAYNARANIKFNGSRITRRSTMASNRGQAQIYLDGQLWGTMNDQTAETRWQVARTWTFASNGTHTLEVRNVGGGGGYTDVDSFIVDVAGVASGTYDDYQTPYIQHIGSWTASANFPSAYNSTVHYSNTATSAAGTTFYGDRITYYYTAAANRGKAWVTIDGVDYGYIDLYSATTQWQRSASWGLSLGYHTIFIGVSGQKNPASSDTYVDVDKFVVNGY